MLFRVRLHGIETRCKIPTLDSFCFFFVISRDKESLVSIDFCVFLIEVLISKASVLPHKWSRWICFYLVELSLAVSWTWKKNIKSIELRLAMSWSSLLRVSTSTIAFEKVYGLLHIHRIVKCRPLLHIYELSLFWCGFSLLFHFFLRFFFITSLCFHSLLMSKCSSSFDLVDWFNVHFSISKLWKHCEFSTFLLEFFYQYKRNLNQCLIIVSKSYYIGTWCSKVIPSATRMLWARSISGVSLPFYSSFIQYLLSINNIHIVLMNDMRYYSYIFNCIRARSYLLIWSEENRNQR